MEKRRNISLRALETSDVDFMYEAENDPQLWKYSDTVAPLSKELIYDYAKNYDGNIWKTGQLRLMIEYSLNDGLERAGMIDLFDISPRHRHASVGIYVSPFFRGKGIATDSLQQLHQYAKNVLALHTLMAQIPLKNIASKKLFEKSGYSLSGIIPHWFDTCGEIEDVAVMYKSLLNLAK